MRVIDLLVALSEGCYIRIINSDDELVASGHAKEVLRNATHDLCFSKVIAIDIMGNDLVEVEIGEYVNTLSNTTVSDSYFKENKKAKSIFDVLCRICNNFNENLASDDYNKNLNEIYRGEYIGIQLISKCIGYKVDVQHSLELFYRPIMYCSISRNYVILYERRF